jgi:tripartite-type tricarboxylate transporter receptor subunit TctC
MCAEHKKSWAGRFGYGVVIAASLLAANASYAESAADYPSRPLHIVSGFEPGGATDVVARLLGKRLTMALGQSVIVDNRPGAAGNIGAAYVARSAPDGYTMYLTNATIAMPSLFKSLPFNVRKDFAFPSLVGYGPSIMVVNPKLPVRSVSEFIAYAKQHQGKVDFGSGGIGNITHMAMALFISMTGLKLVHIPYKGGAPATAAVLTNEVPVAFSAISDVLGQVKQGSLIPLAVSSRQRVSALPNVPTVAEAGVPGYEASSWYGIVIPAATPRPIEQKLSKAIADALHSKDFQAELRAQGVEPGAGGTKEFTGLVNEEIGKWSKIIAQEHIVAQ